MTDKVEQVHMLLTADDLTFDEMIDIQEGNMRKAKSILVKFAVDANGKALPGDVADELIGKLSITQVKAVFAEFGAQLTAVMNETLPNERGRR